jgi:exosortase/archaeosortase family protein
VFSSVKNATDLPAAPFAFGLAQRLSLPLVQALFLTIGAIVCDLIATPALYSTSPISAAAILLALVLRTHSASNRTVNSPRLGLIRISMFAVAHLALNVVAQRGLPGALGTASGTISLAGWLIALMKLSVLVPTLFLLPLAVWRSLARQYRDEIVAAFVALSTFFPRRLVTALWPWYGQVLGRIVYALAWPLVPSLGYVRELSPTLTARDLDVTIILACSGVNGVELFQCLFAFIAVLDWNRLRKGPALLAYLGGILAMLIGNVLRITSFVVFGNHGLTELVLRIHLAAGWLFFSAVFVAYLCLTYRWWLAPSAPRRA